MRRSFIRLLKRASCAGRRSEVRKRRGARRVIGASILAAGLLAAPVGLALEGGGGGDEMVFAVGGGDELEADGEVVFGEAAGEGEGREAEEVPLGGVAEVDEIVLAEGEGGAGGGGGEEDVGVAEPGGGVGAEAAEGGEGGLVAGGGDGGAAGEVGFGGGVEEFGVFVEALGVVGVGFGGDDFADRGPRGPVLNP
jgi:hypothetical protein